MDIVRDNIKMFFRVRKILFFSKLSCEQARFLLIIMISVLLINLFIKSPFFLEYVSREFHRMIIDEYSFLFFFF